VPPFLDGRSASTTNRSGEEREVRSVVAAGVTGEPTGARHQASRVRSIEPSIDSNGKISDNAGLGGHPHIFIVDSFLCHGPVHADACHSIPPQESMSFSERKIYQQWMACSSVKRNFTCECWLLHLRDKI
jgi:hypothetical protein